MDLDEIGREQLQIASKFVEYSSDPPPTAQWKEKIAKMLESADFHIDVRNERGDTALMEAAYRGNQEAVEYLLDLKANINLQGTSFGNTALGWAAINGHSSVLKTLSERKANPDITNKLGLPPAMEAAVGKKYKCVRDLVVHFGERMALDSPLYFSLWKSDRFTRRAITDGLRYVHKRGEDERMGILSSILASRRHPNVAIGVLESSKLYDRSVLKKIFTHLPPITWPEEKIERQLVLCATTPKSVCKGGDGSEDETETTLITTADPEEQMVTTGREREFSEEEGKCHGDVDVDTEISIAEEDITTRPSKRARRT